MLGGADGLPALRGPRDRRGAAPPRPGARHRCRRSPCCFTPGCVQFRRHHHKAPTACRYFRARCVELHWQGSAHAPVQAGRYRQAEFPPPISTGDDAGVEEKALADAAAQPDALPHLCRRLRFDVAQRVALVGSSRLTGAEQRAVRDADTIVRFDGIDRRRAHLNAADSPFDPEARRAALSATRTPSCASTAWTAGVQTPSP